MLQVKPIVLTILISTIAICHITKLVSVLVCIIVLLIIHTPILEGLAIQLDLANFSPRHTKLAAELVTINLGASTEVLTTKPSGSTTR